MIVLPLALSLSNTVTEIGAIAAFAALFGIAILSLLVFSQAREIKRLREWAGRAPERAAEMEQRVSADAAARLQRGGAPAPAHGVRVVPRKTPLVSAPVSTAVNATVAAVVPAATPSAGAPVVESTPETGGEVKSAAMTGSPAQPGGAQGSEPAGGVAATGEALAGGEAAAAEEVVARQPAQPAVPTASAPPAGGPEEVTERPALVERSAGEPGTPAPVTAAARAAGVSARSSLPPSPAAPAPPGAPSSSGPSSSPASAAVPVASAPKQASRPPAPVAAARRVPSRTVGGASDAPPRSPSPPRTRAASAGAGTAGGRSAVTRPATAAGAAGPKYFEPERSSGTVALIAGGVIVGVLVLIFAVTALKGGGSKATATQSSLPTETQPASSHTRTTAHAVLTNPAETGVVVLNGTATAGLAHHLAADLQQSGYTHAAASAGVPPGTHATTVVEYVRGHRADAQAVAKKLNVTKVQAIETTIAPLAGSSIVVVLAGADQASLLGGGGAQSNGEPAAGTPAGQ